LSTENNKESCLQSKEILVRKGFYDLAMRTSKGTSTIETAVYANRTYGGVRGRWAN
jgi:hypothetical protein